MDDTYHKNDSGFKDEPTQSKCRLPAPKSVRKHEVRGGGFIVIERTPKKKLLRPAAWPVEIEGLAEAFKAAKKLKERYPDKEFCIFEQVGSIAVSEEV